LVAPSLDTADHGLHILLQNTSMFGPILWVLTAMFYIAQTSTEKGGEGEGSRGRDESKKTERKGGRWRERWGEGNIVLNAVL